MSEMILDARAEFHRVRIFIGPGNILCAMSTGGQRSSRAASLNGANGLAILHPLAEGGPKKIEIGEFMEAILIGEVAQPII